MVAQVAEPRGARSRRAPPARREARSADGQRLFHEILSAIFNPGRPVLLCAGPDPMAPLNAATTAACLVLMSAGTPLWSDLDEESGVSRALARRWGIPRAATPEMAAFAAITAPRTMPALTAFNQGSDDHPERSTTLIIQVDGLEEMACAEAGSGGVADGVEGAGAAAPRAGTHRLRVSGLPAGLWVDLTRNNARYPYGVDVMLTCGRQLVALPRWMEVTT